MWNKNSNYLNTYNTDICCLIIIKRRHLFTFKNTFKFQMTILIVIKIDDFFSMSCHLIKWKLFHAISSIAKIFDWKKKNNNNQLIFKTHTFLNLFNEKLFNKTNIKISKNRYLEIQIPQISGIKMSIASINIYCYIIIIHYIPSQCYDYNPDLYSLKIPKI